MGKRAQHENYCWVDFKGEIVHVSTFADLAPGNRPKVTCPVCNEIAILHLGSKRLHHYQHHPEAHSLCPLFHGESALHFNAKHHLRRELEKTRELTVFELCADINKVSPLDFDKCQGRKAAVFAHGWDQVVVERTLEGLRPDVLLLADGRPVAALEVLVSHSVSDAKQEALNALGMPWIEVRARDVLKWTAPEALRTVQRSPTATPWRCPYHMESRQKEARFQAQLVEAARTIGLFPSIDACSHIV